MQCPDTQESSIALISGRNRGGPQSFRQHQVYFVQVANSINSYHLRAVHTFYKETQLNAQLIFCKNKKTDQKPQPIGNREVIGRAKVALKNSTRAPAATSTAGHVIPG